VEPMHPERGASVDDNETVHLAINIKSEIGRRDDVRDTREGC